MKRNQVSVKIKMKYKLYSTAYKIGWNNKSRYKIFLKKSHTPANPRFSPPFLIKQIRKSRKIIKKVEKISIRINPFFKRFRQFIYCTISKSLKKYRSTP